MLATISTCTLNQWAMDFLGNYTRILQSCREAKRLGARYRVGPELEIVGYGAEDHYLEMDTIMHAEEMLARLLGSDATIELLCDFGLPMLHGDVRYNVRVLCLNQEIIAIRPKQALAGDGNYREPRWFARWAKPYVMEDHALPAKLLIHATAKRVVPFGDLYLKLIDTSIGVESCEELFTPDATHVRLGLNGVEIIGNGSGSHHQLRKLDTRVNLVRNATSRNGGVYLYSNQIGCDGGRLGFDGCSMISINGDLVAQGSQFAVKDVEVICATVDLEAVRSYRCFSASRTIQAAEHRVMPFVSVNWHLCKPDSSPSTSLVLSVPRPVRYHSPEEEIAMGPAIWLWDYLRRSGGQGYFLPLSGGADSSSTASIVYSMCRMVAQAIDVNTPVGVDIDNHRVVVQDVARITGISADRIDLMRDPKFLSDKILHTSYMGTTNSSTTTRDFATSLTREIGNYHISCDIDGPIQAILSLFYAVTGLMPKYKVHGGRHAENQALQNIQARFRMLFGYMFAQLLPLVRGRGGGFLLVLGSANVDEGLRGYLTKYDCSSADVNPIGGISKTDLKRFLKWGATPTGLGLSSLQGILEQPPTAELEPITATHKQTDEEDMGCTYDELSVFGRLRKIELLGPVSMFRKCVHLWGAQQTPKQVADKIKFLWSNYSINRHKMTTITPSYHCEAYSPDDNRYDLRQFLYNNKWPLQFERIDVEVKRMEAVALPAGKRTAHKL